VAKTLFKIEGTNRETGVVTRYFQAQDNAQNKFFNRVFNHAPRDHNSYWLIGGAIGGGKTKCLVALVIGYASRYPGSRIYVTRKDATDLKDTTYKDFISLCPPSMIRSPKTALADLADMCKDVTFTNGSLIMFRELKDLSGKFGLEVNMVVIDECGEVDYDIYMAMDTRLRPFPNSPKDAPFLMVLTANPTPAWPKSVFIDDNKPHHNYIHLSPSDNVDLLKQRPNYIKDLMEKFPRSWVERYLKGSWDIVIEGAVFKEWDSALHVVEPFNIPSHWIRVFALDPHMAKPMCGLWYAQSPDGDEGYIYDELQSTPEDSFQDFLLAMLAREREHSKGATIYRVLDYSLSTVLHKKGNGKSLRDIINRMGLGFSNANKKSKWDNILLVKDRLKNEKTSLPLLYFFSNCKTTIKQMKNYRFTDNDGTKDFKEKILKVDDDFVDCTQYVMAMRPWLFQNRNHDTIEGVTYIGNHYAAPDDSEIESKLKGDRG